MDQFGIEQIVKETLNGTGCFISNLVNSVAAIALYLVNNLYKDSALA